MDSRYVFDVKSLSEYLNLGRRQTYELIKKKRFPVKQVGTKYLIPKSGVDEWLCSASMYNAKLHF